MKKDCKKKKVIFQCKNIENYEKSKKCYEMDFLAEKKKKEKKRKEKKKEKKKKIKNFFSFI